VFFSPIHSSKRALVKLKSALNAGGPIQQIDRKEGRKQRQKAEMNEESNKCLV
jgi:hypothetical protein